MTKLLMTSAFVLCGLVNCGGALSYAETATPVINTNAAKTTEASGPATSVAVPAAMTPTDPTVVAAQNILRLAQFATGKEIKQEKVNTDLPERAMGLNANTQPVPEPEGPVATNDQPTVQRRPADQ